MQILVPSVSRGMTPRFSGAGWRWSQSLQLGFPVGDWETEDGMQILVPSVSLGMPPRVSGWETEDGMRMIVPSVSRGMPPSVSGSGWHWSQSLQFGFPAGDWETEDGMRIIVPSVSLGMPPRVSGWETDDFEHGHEG
ncbi:MAG: hypothetical protein AAGA75_17845 [Cyanobacteria bacterium P01_E01_bin.6]